MLDGLPSLKETVDQFGLAAKKSLGQNFLLNMDTVRKVARMAGKLGDCAVVEIGPGPGGLTRALLEAGAKRVISIEHDPRCIEALQPLIIKAEGRLRVVHADALTVRPQDLCPDEPLKIVANLPYNVGTQLLVNWLHDLDNIQSMTLMFQKEVALRIIAKPRTADYGRLTILSQYLANVQKMFDLPPGAFSPPPKVTSSIVNLIPKPDVDLSILPALEKITHAAFGQRRKMIRSSLGSLFAVDDLAFLGIKETARAEELLLEQFIKLARNFK
ncbi:MAG: 16S rRNA (adenine(1518)-N(6)/adenine(1519)-N(6))-dimethyltransferase RsmA [Candidatus Paracaedibacteraceae bacterium]|nr:16S rRNA (adenine(1518)-N(6)/adenine(1519)-N(6))-dimethyltransferase RsmA [Candidatus Paracaedibacteraceae bacterium]